MKLSRSIKLKMLRQNLKKTRQTEKVTKFSNQFHGFSFDFKIYFDASDFIRDLLFSQKIRK